jgi:hypothetical protein
VNTKVYNTLALKAKPRKDMNTTDGKKNVGLGNFTSNFDATKKISNSFILSRRPRVFDTVLFFPLELSVDGC